MSNLTIKDLIIKAAEDGKLQYQTVNSTVTKIKRKTSRSKFGKIELVVDDDRAEKMLNRNGDMGMLIFIDGDYLKNIIQESLGDDNNV